MNTKHLFRIGVAIMCCGVCQSKLSPFRTVNEAIILKGGTTEQRTAIHNPKPKLIPINFDLPIDAEVTLIVEDVQGRRIRNLISQVFFPQGRNTTWWDGTDDLGRDPDAYEHGVYSIPKRLVSPGKYVVRGLYHRKLDLRYEMAVYSSGTPPWPTPTGTGGWMTNHTPASSVAFIPARSAPGKRPLIYIGAYISEGGSALSWVDLEGRKQGGRGWIGGTWTGAQYLAYDAGPRADPAAYLYVGSVWQDKLNPAEVRLTRLTSQGDNPVIHPVFRFTVPEHIAQLESALGGMAIHNGVLVFSQTSLNKLIFVNTKSAHVLGNLPIDSPRGLAFDSQGRLLVLSGHSLLRFMVDARVPSLTAPETLISELDDPQGITTNSSGQVFVSDQGQSNQVKMYSAEGRALVAFGQKGPSQAGLYNPLHMNHPKGIAVDRNGRLWVAENDFQPKRVSVWNADGTLWKAFYGPPQYGGGGVLDPRNRNLFLYDGMEFELNWEAGTYELRRVYYRTGAQSGGDLFGDFAPDTPIYIQNGRYLTDAFRRSATGGAPLAFLFLDKGDVAVPAAGVGRAQDWELLKHGLYRKLWPKGIGPEDRIETQPAFFVWNDLNGNGQPNVDEIVIYPGFSGGITIGSDGSFLISHFSANAEDRGHALRLRPLQISPRGIPIYALSRAQTLAPSQNAKSDGGNQVLAGTNGWTLQSTAPPPFSPDGIGGSRGGLALWSYPSLWPGLHPSHSSPVPDSPGMLIGTTRLLGPVINEPAIGPMVFINGNHGNFYVFTQDGLFVSRLFQDMRQGQPWHMPVEQRGALLNELTLHDENFYPSVTQQSDGQVYLVAGAIPAIVRIFGLGSIRRLPDLELRVSAEQLRESEEYFRVRERRRQAAGPEKLVTIPMLPDFPSENSSPENRSSDWIMIDTRGVPAYFDAKTTAYNIKGAIAIWGRIFVLTYETGNPKLLENSGQDSLGLFHTGGGLDLMLQTDPKADPLRSEASRGDVRLFVTRVRGRTRAIIYRSVAVGATPINRALLRSQWPTIGLDVQDVSEIVKLTEDGRGRFEVQIPVEQLGLLPKAGMKVRGDIGVLRGNGGETVDRVYWANKVNPVFSDVPSEAKLTPDLWGIFSFDERH